MFEDDDSEESPKKKRGLARLIDGLNPLAKSTPPGFDKIGAVISSGASVQADARKLALMLASYGEGERLGKYAFSSTELAGRPAASRKDAHDRPYDEPAVQGSLGIPGARLNDAVHFLKEHGWAKTTYDGEFAPGCDFHEVSLTATGRSAIQGKVAAGDESLGFAGMPSMDGPSTASAKTNDRDAMLATLSKAKIKFSVEHGDDTSTISHAGGVFNFDADGALIGVGKE